MNKNERYEIDSQGQGSSCGYRDTCRIFARKRGIQFRNTYGVQSTYKGTQPRVYHPTLWVGSTGGGNYPPPLTQYEKGDESEGRQNRRAGSNTL